MNIDWSKAPEWAKQVGETRSFRHICWIGDDYYGYVGSEPDYYDLAKGPGRLGNRSLSEFDIISDRPKVDPWSGEGLPPIRTTEQIAAEEREKGIVEMARSMMAGTVVAGDADIARATKLYDAGYRKQVKP